MRLVLASRLVPPFVLAFAAIAFVGCATTGESTSATTVGGSATAGATSAPEPTATTTVAPATAASGDPASAGTSKKCRKDTGCPAGAPIPSCADVDVTADYVGVTLADLNKNRAKYKGTKIGVTGPLDVTGPGACTEMGCPPDYPCCNTCTGGLVLGKYDREMKTALLLRAGAGGDIYSADPLACTGDDTMVCCKHTPGGTVTAYGKLVAPSGDPNPYVLSEVNLCRP